MVLPPALFLELADDHIYCPSVASKATLTLRDDIVQQLLCEAIQQDTGHDLPCNAWQ